MSDLKSDAGPGEACSLRFCNQRSTDVQVFWLDFEGRAVSYGMLPPGQSVDQATYVGHAWRLCDEASGLALAEYAGTSAMITLQEDGSVRVVSTSAATLDSLQPLPAPAAAAMPPVADDSGGEEEESEEE